MKFSRSDALFTLLVTVLSLLLGLAYFHEINTGFIVRDAEQLGSIVFRRGSATRRPGESLRWERLRNESPVYQGDVIRTARRAEAGLIFDDGTSLDIHESTMVALSYDDMVREIEFLGGTIYIGGDSESGRPTRVRIGDTVVEAGGDAQVAVSSDGTRIAVDVAGGEAEITQESGLRSRLAPNSTYTLNTETGASSAQRHDIVPLWPRQNSRLVHQLQDTVELELQFRTELPPAADLPVVLEISDSAGFDVVSARRDVLVPAGQTELVTVPVELPVGQWYWRVRSVLEDDVELQSPVRRFRVLYSELPHPLRPERDHSVSYRREHPRVRFAWTRDELAGSYVLEVARDEGFSRDVRRMRTVQPGISVDSLDAGEWYWRVSPVLPFEYLHVPVASPPRRLVVLQNDVMSPLQLGLPAAGTLFELQRMQRVGLSFSWQPISEAHRYQVLLSPSQDIDPSSEEVIRAETAQPFARITPEQLGNDIVEKSWYWTGRWQDGEGSWSSFSEARRLEAVDGRFAVRLLYPHEGFTIADSLSPTARFTWSSNVAAPTVFQLSEDPLFREGVFEYEVHGDSLFGRKLNPGEYFWRVRTFNVDGSVFLETAPREVRIAPPLPRTELEQPVPGQTHVLVDGDTALFVWAPVPGADYYRFQLFPVGAELPLHDEGLLYAPECSVQLGVMPNGRYRAVIQAFALPSENSTRIIGYRAEFPFASYRLAPVDLQQPADGEVIEGLSALRKGIILVWEASDTPDTVRIELQRNGTEYAGPFGATEESIAVPRLRPGSYEWQVIAELQGFDLSSRDRFSFTVLPVPPMPKPILSDPAAHTEIGPEQLAGRETIQFRWEPVDEANRYVVGLYEVESGREVMVRQDLERNTFTLEDLSLLQRGEFRWEVKGQYVADDGYLEQDGRFAEGRFRISLPELMLPERVGEAEFYGY